MNLIDANSQEPISFEKLVYIDSLKGISAGRQRVMAVLHDPVQVGLGSKSWYDLAQWLGQRGIVSAVQGPLYTAWKGLRMEDSFRDFHIYEIMVEARALVRLHADEDVVRYERELLRTFGRPYRWGYRQSIPLLSVDDQEIEDWIWRHVLGEIERGVGGLPGRDLVQRLPG
jgi:hypothetical protein